MGRCCEMRPLPQLCGGVWRGLPRRALSSQWKAWLSLLVTTMLGLSSASSVGSGASVQAHGASGPLAMTCLSEVNQNGVPESSSHFRRALHSRQLTLMTIPLQVSSESWGEMALSPQEVHQGNLWWRHSGPSLFRLEASCWIQFLGT